MELKFRNKRIAITKNLYLKGYACVVLLLALVRLLFPSVAADVDAVEPTNDTPTEAPAELNPEPNLEPTATLPPTDAPQPSRFTGSDGKPIKNRIRGVASFSDAFPDLQDVQIQAANKFGVKPVEDRGEAESRKMELVYVGANPYFNVQQLHSSIPYLVPRAAVLLQDIGRNFFDSLQMKGVPLHKINVTSVMRSKADVGRLRNFNGNATENSCHLYGTTFDISYNRYVTVQAPDGPRRREVRNDTLKWVLCEVLRDLRAQQRCYVKYEVKQGCFHITTR